MIIYTAKALKNQQISTNLSKAFKKRIFQYTTTYTNLLFISKSETIGTLPSDIIKNLQKENRAKIISQIIEGFKLTTKALNNKKSKICTKISEETQIYLSSKKKHPELKIHCSAEDILTNLFRNLKIIKKNEKIKINKLGEGSWGKTYNIMFPPKTKISDKVLKTFHVPLSSQTSITNRFHGILPETNASFFLTKVQGHSNKKSISARTYLTSITDNFMLSENINNLPPKFNTEQKFKKLKLWATDIDFKYNYNENVINGRIIDFGSIKQLH